MSPPNEIHVEVHLGGQWIDIPGSIRQDPPITITGREMILPTAQGGNTMCVLVLDDPDGDWSPRNPTSPWHGQWGQKTPLRVWVAGRPAIRVADDYTRTEASGWGTSTSGHTYTGTGFGGSILATDWQVAGGVGLTWLPVAPAYRIMTVDGFAAGDVDVVATVDTAISTVTGADIEPIGVMVRNLGGASYYFGRIEISTGATVTARLMRGDATTLDSATAPITWTGQPLRVRVRAIGTWLGIRVWDATGAEPGTWTAQATDTTIRHTAGGTVAIRAGCATGNTNAKPLECRVDDLVITPVLPRFCGLVSEIHPPDLVDKARSTMVVASGPRWSSEQGDKAVLSPLTRAIAHAGPVAYWPLVDAVQADEIAAGLPGQPPLTLDGLNLAKVPGPDGAPSDLPELVVPGLVASEVMAVGAVVGSSTSTWTIEWVVRASVGVITESFINPINWNAGNIAFTTLLYQDVGTSTYRWSVSAYDVVTTTSYGVVINETVTDGEWHHCVVQVDQDGTDINLWLSLDGSWPVGLGSPGAMTSGDISDIKIISQLDTYAESVSIGHIAVYADTPGRIDAAWLGWPGDTTATRLARIADETGVDLDIPADITGVCGVQRPANILDLINDVLTVDQGVMLESRASNTIVIRSSDDICEAVRTPIELPLTACRSAKPSTSDTTTWNRARVAQPGGSVVVVDMSDGPLGVDTIGPIDRGQYDCYADSTSRCLHVASWIAGTHTIDDQQIVIVADISAGTIAATIAALTAVDPGQGIALTGMPTWATPDDQRSLITTVAETLGQHIWTITVGAWPMLTVGEWDADDSRWSPIASTLAAGVDVDDTTLTVAYVGARWVRAEDHAPSLPFDVLVGGEVMTVTDVNGVTSPQTMTVTRAVNSVVKAHAAGAPVTLRHPVHYALPE